MTCLGDPPNVLPTVSLAEAQVLVQAEAYIVSIKAIRGQAEVEQMLLEGDGNGGFPAG